MYEMDDSMYEKLRSAHPWGYFATQEHIFFTEFPMLGTILSHRQENNWI